MRLVKRAGLVVGLASIVVALGVLTARTVSADTFGCPGGVIDEDVDGNVEIDDVKCIIEEDVTVSGNIEIMDAGLFVSGIVEGNIKQKGPGDDFEGADDSSVVVGSSGVVHGSIKESGPSSVLIDGTVHGNIKEEDDGGVRLFNVPGFEGGPICGIVNGNIEESGNGSVLVDCQLNGNVKEGGIGGVTVGFAGEDATVNGNIIERGDGFPDAPLVSVFITATGVVNGNVKERGPGAVVIQPGGTVNGNINED